MKSDNTFSVEFAQVEIPKLKETLNRKNYYQTNQNDDFFEELIKYYETGNIHSSFINNLVNRIVGSGIVTQDRYSEIISKKYDLNTLFKQITLDYVLYGGFTIEVIWNVLHTQITQLNYIDFSRVRCGMVDDNDQISLFHYSPDWKKWKKDITIYQKFNTNPESDNLQIIYHKDIYPGKDIYPRPDYIGALKWVYVESELTRYYANLVKNNFVATTLLTVNSFMDDEKQINFEKSLKKFTGGDAAGTILVIYNEGGDETTKPGIVKFNGEAEDTKYQWLSNETKEQLIIGHKIPNPLLAGVRSAGSLGASTELETAEKIYNLQTVGPKRKIILTQLNELLMFINKEFKYDVTNINIFDEKIQ